ncbi:MAG: hypothetical protein HZA28_02185 [Candidatus Omnitrophica bacterium]|nr:hypothetical protein [Candidatus Omnitrophota bacterium]
MLVDLLLIVLLGPIGIIIVIFRHLGGKKKKTNPKEDKDWYLSFALSKEDAVSQLFFLLSFFFLGVTLLAFNRDFGDPLSWRAILLITSAVGLIGAYYLKTIYTLVFSLVGLTGWWAAQAAQWIDGKAIKTSALFAGLSFLALLFYSLGHLHEKEMKYKRFALVYLMLGIITVTGALFFFSTKPGIGMIGEMTKGASFFSSWQLTLSLFIFLVSLVSATLYSAAQKLLSFFELLTVFALTCLFGIAALLPEQSMFVQAGRSYDFYSGGELSNTGVCWALVYNFAIFFELLGLIFSGYVRRETWLINLGALFLFLLIIVKYFDWFFTSLDKSIFFIGAGILLFVVGWFMERGRRYMISNIEARKQQIPQ